MDCELCHTMIEISSTIILQDLHAMLEYLLDPYLLFGMATLLPLLEEINCLIQLA